MGGGRQKLREDRLGAFGWTLQFKIMGERSKCRLRRMEWSCEDKLRLRRLFEGPFYPGG